MYFTWNKTKSKASLKKHGLDFANAEKVFSGHTLTRPDTRFAYTENRFYKIGLLGVDVVAIVHTKTKDEIHIISMRKAERYEQKNYFATLQ